MISRDVREDGCEKNETHLASLPLQRVLFVIEVLVLMSLLLSVLRILLDMPVRRKHMSIDLSQSENPHYSDGTYST